MGRVRYQIPYTRLPSQRQFHDLASTYKGFSGPVGSGKSMCLAQEAIRLAFINAGLTGLIGAPTFPMLRDVTQPAIMDVLTEAGIPFSHHKQENRLTLKPTGSSILFRSLENPERLRGTNLAWFGIDEMTYCKQAAFLRLQARLRHPRAKRLCGFGVWTPNGFDWVYDMFIGENKNAGYEVVLGQARENYHVTQTGLYDQLAASYDERFYAQEVLGQYLNIRTGGAYTSFDPQVHMQARTVDRNAEIWVTCDFNIDHMAWLIAQVFEDRIEILDEICMAANINTQAAELARRLEALASWRPITVKVTGDSAGNSRNHAGETDYQLIYDYFRNSPTIRVKDYVPRSSPSVRDRVNSVNALLRNANGQVRLLIHPQCKTLRKDLERVGWLADSNGNLVGDLDKKDPKLTHSSDALGYLVHLKFPVTAFRREVRKL